MDLSMVAIEIHKWFIEIQLQSDRDGCEFYHTKSKRCQSVSIFYMHFCFII